MTYETVIPELFERLPAIRSTYESEFRYMGDGPPLAYIVFGSVLIPYLEAALETGDLQKILTVCAFLEDASDSARKDVSLEALLQVEVGEWLGWAANEDRLVPWLGPETKRICGYVPGLATQRLHLKEKQEKSNLRYCVTSAVKRVFSR
jgi:hypothetical protein